MDVLVSVKQTVERAEHLSKHLRRQGQRGANDVIVL